MMTTPTEPGVPTPPPGQPTTPPIAPTPPPSQATPSSEPTAATQPAPPPASPPAQPIVQPAPTPEGKARLTYKQFLGRAITASLVAPIGFLLAGLLFFGLVAGCAAALGSQPVDDGPLSFSQHVDGVDGASDVVLVVDVNGVILAEGGGGGLGPFGGAIAGGDTIQGQLEAAAEDPDVDAVILRLNTPGGSPVGSARISEGVEAIQAAGKPVIAHVTEISASGGMWAMAPADYIVASDGAIVGSIGVRTGPFQQFTDVVAIDGGLLGGGVTTTGGIDQFFITAGEGKVAGGNPFREFSAEEQEEFQNLADGLYDQFVDHVATNREISPATIVSELGASVFTAPDAVDNGLIDEAGNFDRAHEEAADRAGLTGDYDVRVLGDDLGILGDILGVRDDTPPVADVSSLCSPTPIATVFSGDLAAWCGLTG